MNIVSNSSGNLLPEGIFAIHQAEQDGSWKIASGSETGVLSLSVFGTARNRYSVMIIEKEYLSSDYAGKDGKWYLSERNGSNEKIRFDLQWSVEAAGSGCFVLCGHEVTAPFSNSA